MMNHSIHNYIDGQLVGPANGQYLDLIEPATGDVYGQIARSQNEDVLAAVDAAGRAAKLWRDIGVKKRAAYLRDLADGIKQNLDAFAAAESKDSGKPLSLTTSVDIPRSIENLNFFADAALQWESKAYSGQAGINYVLNKPAGIAACISPWNLPLYLFTWKIAPALAAGCTVVAKPSEMTPMTAYMLSELCIKIGLPNGVLNIIHGLGAEAGASLVANPKIKRVSFTGGTTTGKTIAKSCSERLTKYSLELGGKNPVLIFDDVDVDKAVSLAVRAGFTNQGQICLCGSRIYIQESIYESFKKRFVEAVKALKVGDPNEQQTQQGSLISEAHKQKVIASIAEARDLGANILCGGSELKPSGRCKGGYFVTPTVIEGLSPDAGPQKHEIFGPVVTLTPFSSEEEVIDLANDSTYGLSSVVMTNDISRAHRVAESLEVGIVWLNGWMVRDLRTPFGGFKNSGVGREGGFHALEFFADQTNVCICL